MALTKEQVMEKMKEKDTVVLNVLAKEEYDKLRIKGSGSLPWGKDAPAFTKLVGSRYGKDKFFITHCANYSCPAGPDAAKALKAAGFRAEDYPGGIQEWSQAGLPTEGSMAPKAPAHR